MLKNITIQSVKDLRQMCLDYPDYRGLCLVKNSEIQDAVFGYAIDNFDGIQKVISSSHTVTTADNTIKYMVDKIIYINGSSIVILIPRDCSKGSRVNAILYDADINEQLLQNIYKPMLIDYQKPYVKPTAEVVELDLKSDILTGSVENFSSYIDPNPGDWDDPIFDDDDEIDW